MSPRRARSISSESCAQEVIGAADDAAFAAEDVGVWIEGEGLRAEGDEDEAAAGGE